MADVDLAEEPGGWWRASLSPRAWPGLDGAKVRVRVQVDDGRAVLTAVHVERSGGVDGATLRLLPLGLIAASVQPLPAAPAPPRADITVADLEAQEQRLGLGRATLDRRRPGEEPRDFYMRVARQYLYRVRESARPAAALAEEAGVPVTTVHRWIAEARRRGHLPPGRQGRRG